MKIAICITTHNRKDIFEQTLAQHKKYVPKNGRIFVVDDASDEPVKSDFRFTENVGIAKAKNKCLELAKEWGADHIFLFDSDCYPKVKNWWQSYVEHREPHLMYIFTKFATDGVNGHNLKDCQEIYRDKTVVGYNHVRGCMLYIDAKVLDIVGGFDTRYGKAMYEHTDWSNRIHNAGLTTMRVMDVPNSNKLIYSMDEHREVSSSITAQDRRTYLIKNKPRHRQSLTSTEYCEYKQTNNVVISSYFAGHYDWQRKKEWQPDSKAIEPLKKSVEHHNEILVLLHNCFDLPHKTECVIDPYFQRILSAYHYLRDHTEIDKAFVVDATDVTMLNNPFNHVKKGTLYVGCEETKLGINWIMKRAGNIELTNFLRQHRHDQLLNIGIIGGYREDVLKVLHAIMSYFFDNYTSSNLNDMVVFNYVMKRFTHVTGTGLVNNLFKSYKPTTKAAEWFLHK